MVLLNALHSLDHPEILQIAKMLGSGSSWELSQRKGCLCAECRILVLMSLWLFRPVAYSSLAQLSEGWNEQDCPSQRPCVAKEQ